MVISLQMRTENYLPSIPSVCTSLRAARVSSNAQLVKRAHVVTTTSYNVSISEREINPAFRYEETKSRKSCVVTIIGITKITRMLGGVVGRSSSIVVLLHLKIVHIVIQRQIFDAFLRLLEVFRLWLDEIIAWLGFFKWQLQHIKAY